MDEQILVPMDEFPAPPPAETTTVVDVHFRSGGKVYYFDPGDLQIAAGDHVIIDTSRGVEYGICAAGNHTVSTQEIVPPLRKVLRIATAADEKTAAENREKEKRAYDVCLKRIADQGLDMQLVSAECAFDGSKILFFFTADGRVDFRELVKSLASVFRTRIELRQIGVRDKAKMIGGLGVCGRPFCCTEFLDDFQPVSIKMAKVQNLSLNPTKISGTCGRLMCCLKYEQAAYEDLLRTSPKNESFVDTPDGRGTVTEVNLLRQSVKVRMEDHPEEINTYRNTDICVLRSGKAKKNDPPIPKELAPISSNKAARAAYHAREAEQIFLEPVIIRSMPETLPEEPKPQPTQQRSSRRHKKPQTGEAQAQQEAAREQQPKPAAPAQDGEHPLRKEGGSRRRRKPRGPKPEGAGQNQRSAAQGEQSKNVDRSKAAEHSKPAEHGDGNSPKSGNRRHRHHRRSSGNGQQANRAEHKDA